MLSYVHQFVCNIEFEQQTTTFLRAMLLITKSLVGLVFISLLFSLLVAGHNNNNNALCFFSQNRPEHIAYIVHTFWLSVVQRQQQQTTTHNDGVKALLCELLEWLTNSLLLTSTGAEWTRACCALLMHDEDESNTVGLVH